MIKLLSLTNTDTWLSWLTHKYRYLLSSAGSVLAHCWVTAEWCWPGAGSLVANCWRGPLSSGSVLGDYGLELYWQLTTNWMLDYSSVLTTMLLYRQLLTSVLYFFTDVSLSEWLLADVFLICCLLCLVLKWRCCMLCSFGLYTQRPAEACSMPLSLSKWLCPYCKYCVNQG